MDEAIEGAHMGLFFNHGQVCCAGSRVFVEEKIYDKFVEQSTARAQKRTVGDPFDAEHRARSASGSNAVRQGHGLHRVRPAAKAQNSSAAADAWETEGTSSSRPFSPTFRTT